MGQTFERFFTIEEHEDYGEIGFRPSDMPNADPLGGMAIPHDLLEHGPDDDGGVEAELRALGACYWLRHESGFTEYRNRHYRGAAEALGGDFPELFRHTANEGFDLGDPGDNGADIELDSIFVEIARAGAADIRTMLGAGEDAFAMQAWCTDAAIERVARWLAIGYREAQERFAEVSSWTLAQDGFAKLEKLAESVEPETHEIGTEYRAAITIEGGEVTAVSFEPREPDPEYCDECGETEIEDYWGHGNPVCAGCRVGKLDRAEVIELLEGLGVACFDDESTDELREALAESVESGDVDI